MSARAWVLNLDAESELELGARYTPSEASKQHVERASALVELPEGDVRVGRDVVPAESVGRAWCPTSRALATLRAAGASVPADSPSDAVLRRVNERGFAFELALGEWPDALRATLIDEVSARVASAGPTGQWLMKRAFGVAGRGQRSVRAGALSEADHAWALASLRRHAALYVEPRAAITRELSVHGWVTRAGVEVRSIRAPEMQSRAFVRGALARDLDASVERALVDGATRVGEALRMAEYVGPFGVDAFEWRTPSGALALRTLSEINARFCMGWDARDGWDPPSSGPRVSA